MCIVYEAKINTPKNGWFDDVWCQKLNHYVGEAGNPTWHGAPEECPSGRL